MDVRLGFDLNKNKKDYMKYLGLPESIMSLESNRQIEAS